MQHCSDAEHYQLPVQRCCSGEKKKHFLHFWFPSRSGGFAYHPPQNLQPHGQVREFPRRRVIDSGAVWEVLILQLVKCELTSATSVSLSCWFWHHCGLTCTRCVSVYGPGVSTPQALSHFKRTLAPCRSTDARFHLPEINPRICHRVCMFVGFFYFICEVHTCPPQDACGVGQLALDSLKKKEEVDTHIFKWLYSS